MEVKSAHQLPTSFKTTIDSEYSPGTSDCDEEDEEAERAVNSDSWDEEDNSEDSGSESEDLEVFEERFRALIDHKIKVAETFCDHQHYVFSFAPPPSEKTVPEPETVHVLPDSPTPPDVESAIDVAREEISKLRITRDVFVNQKAETAARLKMEESEEDARWLYECEEAVEAIDTIIDYKNEIICGRQDESLTRLFRDRAEESDLMTTRLMNLSPTEQYRLFCKFFNKDVELRHSSKSLERTADQVQNENEEIIRCNKRLRRRLKKQDEAVADHFKYFTLNQSSSTERNDDGERNHRHHHHRDEQGPSSSRRQRIFLKGGHN